ncbi:outer membrane beta-barrel protein [bacterium]|nr:outer membrane beta-barrel protein [bacterium]
MNTKHSFLFVLVLIVAILVLPLRTFALEYNVGAHLGTCSYQDELGSMYDQNALMFGLHGQLMLYPLFGITLQYDYLATSSGEIPVMDTNNTEFDHVETEIQGQLISITPTVLIKWKPDQLFVPQIGLGYSLFNGKQTIDKNPYCEERDSSFDGSGFNVTAGFIYNLKPRYAVQLEGRYHWLQIAIDDGSGDEEKQSNGFAELYAGFVYRFGDLH